MSGETRDPRTVSGETPDPRPVNGETSGPRPLCDTSLRPALAAAAALAAAVAIGWSGSLDASFQFDDWNVIAADPRVQSLAAWWHALPTIRPLLKLTYALGHELDAGPRGFRALNLGVHLANALLLFGLVRRRMTRSGVADGRALFVAFACAACFALEPVQTEAVTYVSGRSSALVALPCLAALHCWERATDPRARGSAPTLALHALGILCYAAALAVKETAVVLPLALVLWHSTGARSPAVGVPRWATSERLALGGYLAVAAAALALACASPTYRHLAAVSLATRSIVANVAMQTRAWGFLAGELVRLSALDADPPAAAFATSAPGSLLWASPWIVLGAAGWKLRARAPLFTLCVGWFVVWLLPTNSVIPRLDPANDRQLYLALIGPAWIVALGLARLYATRAAYGWAALAPMLLLLAAATADRNRVYRTELTFWRAALDRSPSDARAANNLGIAYALACRDADAAGAFTRAIALDPADDRPRINLRLLTDHALTRPAGDGCPLATPPR